MRTFLSFLLIITISNLTTAQTTAIPDVNFEQRLINLGYDSGVPDGVVLTANINNVTIIDVSYKNISDLTGIEDFTALTRLYCSNNQLINLNVTQNTALTYLYCNNNQLTNLDVTQNTALTFFVCDDNQLTSLDVTQNTLTSLYCNNNQLTCLNVKNGNNTYLTWFNSSNNPSLTCIEVDNVSYSTTSWTSIDPASSFSTSCANPCSVGIYELSSSSISIHPNPTSGQIIISLEDKTSGSLRVLNSLGQVVLKEEFEGIRELNISIDEPSGIYFLQLESGGVVITKKIIKE